MTSGFRNVKVPVAQPKRSDDDVPRGGTGKVDIRRRRELLSAQGTRVQG